MEDDGATQQIFDAISHGDDAALRRALAAFHGDVNGVRLDEASALMWAVLHRSPTAVKLVLDAGADATHGDNWETLHTAVCDRNLEIMQLLLEAGVNCNTRDSEGCHHTPLTRAVKLREDAAVAALLRTRRCDVNLAGPAGETPLHVALKDGYEYAACLLLDSGANPALEDDFRTNCLERALKSEHAVSPRLARPLVAAFVRHAGIDDATCDRLFFIAIQNGHTELVRELLELGASERINSPNRYDVKFPQYYPLEMAVLSNSKDNPAIVQLLLDAGANPNQQGFTGLYPIHIAASSLNPACVRMLITSGARLDVTTCGHYPTALMLSVKLRHYSAACTLVRHNAQLEVSGQTVLGLVLSELDAAADSPAVSRASCALYRCLRLAGAPVWRIAQLLLHHMQDESPNQEASVEYLAETVRVLREPLTLIEWARVAVRTLLGSALLSRKHLVPIPTVLQEYLLMPDDVLMKSDVRAVFEDSDDKAS